MSQPEEAPSGPIVVRVFCKDARGDAVAGPWVVGAPRPDGFEGLIIRMFFAEDGIYAFYRDDPNRMFGRVLLPWPRITSVEEMMPEAVFAQEIVAAQQYDDDEDEGDDDGETGEEARPSAQRTGTHA